MKTIAKVRVALFVFALLLAPSITRAEQPPQSVEKLTVVDSNNKTVGNVIGFGAGFGTFANHAMVAFRVDGGPIVLAVGPQGFVDIGSGNTIGLFFTTMDCTGDGYRSPEEFVEPSLVPTNLVRGDKVYLQSGSPQFVLLRSAFADTSGLNCVTQEPGELTPMIPMRLLTELSTAFTPPFGLK